MITDLVLLCMFQPYLANIKEMALSTMQKLQRF